jgi:hypothetical protein
VNIPIVGEPRVRGLSWVEPQNRGQGSNHTGATSPCIYMREPAFMTFLGQASVELFLM